MLKFLTRSALVLLLASYAGSAFALFDVQVMAGKRWYVTDEADEDGGKFAAQEFDLAAHLDPIPVVPVAFGVSFQVINPRTEDLHVDAAKGFQGGLDFMGWLPFVPVVTPYARLTLPLFGSWVVENKGTDATTNTEYKTVTTSKVNGYRLGVGAKYSLLPVLDLLFEANLGQEKNKVTEAKVDGEKVDGADGDETTFKSNAIMLGVEMGL